MCEDPGSSLWSLLTERMLASGAVEQCVSPSLCHFIPLYFCLSLSSKANESKMTAENSGAVQLPSLWATLVAKEKKKV